MLRPWLGVARQDRVSTVCSGQMRLHHLDRPERFDCGARGQHPGTRAGEVLKGHEQATGDERDEDVRLEPLLDPTEDQTGYIRLQLLSCASYSKARLDTSLAIRSSHGLSR